MIIMQDTRRARRDPSPAYSNSALTASPAREDQDQKDQKCLVAVLDRRDAMNLLANHSGMVLVTGQPDDERVMRDRHYDRMASRRAEELRPREEELAARFNALQQQQQAFQAGLAQQHEALMRQQQEALMRQQQAFQAELAQREQAFAEENFRLRQQLLQQQEEQTRRQAEQARALQSMEFHMGQQNETADLLKGMCQDRLEEERQRTAEAMRHAEDQRQKKEAALAKLAEMGKIVEAVALSGDDLHRTIGEIEKRSLIVRAQTDRLAMLARERSITVDSKYDEALRNGQIALRSHSELTASLPRVRGLPPNQRMQFNCAICLVFSQMQSAENAFAQYCREYAGTTGDVIPKFTLRLAEKPAESEEGFHTAPSTVQETPRSSFDGFEVPHDRRTPAVVRYPVGLAHIAAGMNRAELACVPPADRESVEGKRAAVGPVPQPVARPVPRPVPQPVAQPSHAEIVREAVAKTEFSEEQCDAALAECSRQLAFLSVSGKGHASC